MALLGARHNYLRKIPLLGNLSVHADNIDGYCRMRATGSGTFNVQPAVVQKEKSDMKTDIQDHYDVPTNLRVETDDFKCESVKIDVLS